MVKKEETRSKGKCIGRVLDALGEGGEKPSSCFLKGSKYSNEKHDSSQKLLWNEEGGKKQDEGSENQVKKKKKRGFECTKSTEATQQKGGGKR